jgi:hypothetical protein
MLENIVIFLVFILAIGFLFKNTFKSFFAKTDAGCAKGCSGCHSVDFEALAKSYSSENEPK